MIILYNIQPNLYLRKSNEYICNDSCVPRSQICCYFPYQCNEETVFRPNTQTMLTQHCKQRLRSNEKLLLFSQRPTKITNIKVKYKPDYK